jgi:manganese/zinc/iron transport system permease protein
MPLPLAMAPLSCAHAATTGLATLAAGTGIAWDEVQRVLTFDRGINTTLVVIGTTLFGLAAALVGPFAMLRGRSLTADAIAHAALPGVAGAFLLASLLALEARSLPVLLVGAALTGALAVGAIALLARHPRVHEDAAIGAVLSVFFGAGVVLLSVVQNAGTGNRGGLDGFIFGQASAINATDATIIGVIAACAIACVTVLHKPLTLVCFNEGFARATGWRSGVIDFLLLAMITVVTIAGLQAVGLVLVVAMLIIPPAAARFWTDRIRVLVPMSGAIGAACGYLGAVVSALVPHKSTGPTIVLVAGGVFAASMMLAPQRGLVAIALRRLLDRVRTASDHLAEWMYDASPTPGRAAPASKDAALAFVRSRGGSRLGFSIVTLLMKAAGELRRSGAALELTPRGIERGARVSRNHDLWAEYLVRYAHIAPSHVDWSVDRVEHVLSEELIGELERSISAKAAATDAAATDAATDAGASHAGDALAEPNAGTDTGSSGGAS